MVLQERAIDRSYVVRDAALRGLSGPHLVLRGLAPFAEVGV